MRRLTFTYLRTEAGAGLLLAVAAAAGVAVANSRYGGAYFHLLAAPVPFRVGDFTETLSVIGWLRGLFMPLVFLVLAMQLKFELTRGELSNPRRLALPALAAAGGLIAPLGLGLALGHGQAWTVGLATDGSVALAVLAAAAPRLAHPLKVLLMSVALADNLAGVALAALASPGVLHWPMVGGAALVLAGLALLSRWRRAPLAFYAAGFVAVWAFALKSGLDASLAGVACAVTVPVGARRPGQESLLKYVMDSLHPYVAWGVLPAFVFAAAGVSFDDLQAGDFARPAALAILAALVVGKPLGVYGLASLGVALKLARKPVGAKWAEIAGVALLSGVGLTTSYFLAGVAADDAPIVRAAIMAASLIAGLAGGLVLSAGEPQRSRMDAD
ncbi:MAG TPA: Na+/H+ antiporter NhaA [Caulobacteraceae bacterium]|jgi:NhaA family Na+:H+ antiporter